MSGSGRADFYRRVEPVLIALIVMHSLGVGLALLFLTGWGARLGGFGEVSPLFFPRQAGAFHLVVATAYAVEYFRHGGVTILLAAKSLAVVFLLIMSLPVFWPEGVPWSVPFSALVDGLMALAVVWVRRQSRSPSMTR